MSLVAYASSDEGESDEEVKEEEKKSPAAILKSKAPELTAVAQTRTDLPSNIEHDGNSFPIEDDEYDILPNENNISTNLGFSLPAPKHQTSNNVLEKTLEVPTHQVQAPILSALPAPRSQTEILYAEEDELEEEVKAKPKELADIPLPPSKLKKKTVKISIPTLSDYDSDEDTPGKKKLQPSSGKCGLFSLLPEPKHETSKTVGRVLIPHTISKKRTQCTNNLQVTKKVKTSSNEPESKDDSYENSDNEEEPTGFFSFGDNSENLLQRETIKSTEMPSVELKRTVVEINDHKPSLRGPWLGEATPASSLLLSLGAENKVKQGRTSDIEFKNSELDPQPNSSQEWGLEQGPSMAGSNEEYFEENSYPEVGDVQSFIHDEEFLKLQGKKQRGKEAINIIDVHGDDQVSQIDLMKHMTEEKDNRSYGKKNKDMPSSQQRRKHQITYLAFQAKERELELKNQWAQNRQTKRQTQSKYGF